MSLWGDNPRYSIGAIRNAELAEKHFPDWKVRIYHDDRVSNNHLKILSEYSSVELYNFTEHRNISPAFWRFFAAFETDDTVMISRDTDSRLSEREKKCVDNWLTRPESYSIIRDHVRHYDFPMLAGMWGHKGKMSIDTFNVMLEYAKHDYYTSDQVFLREVIWEAAKSDSLIFGLNEDKIFNSERKSILPHFVGQGYDENEQPIYPVE